MQCAFDFSQTLIKPYHSSRIAVAIFLQETNDSGHMPHTQAALYPAIRRAHYQEMEWRGADMVHPCLPSPEEYAWKVVNGKYQPILCALPCGLPELIEVVRRSCVRARCAPPCICFSNRVRYPEMCACEGNPDTCDNIGVVTVEEATWMMTSMTVESHIICNRITHAHVIDLAVD